MTDKEIREIENTLNDPDNDNEIFAIRAIVIDNSEVEINFSVTTAIGEMTDKLSDKIEQKVQELSDLITDAISKNIEETIKKEFGEYKKHKKKNFAENIEGEWKK